MPQLEGRCQIQISECSNPKEDKNSLERSKVKKPHGLKLHRFTAVPRKPGLPHLSLKNSISKHLISLCGSPANQIRTQSQSQGSNDMKAWLRLMDKKTLKGRPEKQTTTQSQKSTWPAGTKESKK